MDIARIASRQGWMVVSGLAQGVDSAAHQGALIGGTGTIGALASGIANMSRSWIPDDTESMCIVSQFSPQEPWSGPRAMQRNATIAGLADRVLVAAAGTSGGSWEMAQLCLKRRKPLFVLDLDSDLAPGNQILIRAGATPVDPTGPESVLSELGGPMTLFD
jgi:DNA processing protein